MAEEKTALESLISSLKQERDELNLQMHLAGMEAKDEYERLASKIDELSSQYDPVKEAVAETGDSLVAALMLAAGEMKNGFHRIRKAISESS